MHLNKNASQFNAVIRFLIHLNYFQFHLVKKNMEYDLKKKNLSTVDRCKKNVFFVPSYTFFLTFIHFARSTEFPENQKKKGKSLPNL